MARRFLSQSLLLTKPSPSHLFPIRSQSNRPLFTDLEQIDLDTTNSSPDPDHLIAFRRIEDAIHRIIVRRSAPDWLPFYPGASYWVPPPKTRSRTVADLVGKLAMNGDDQAGLSVGSERGWPSKSYFIKGAFPHQVEVEAASSNTPQSEDEEG